MAPATFRWRSLEVLAVGLAADVDHRADQLLRADAAADVEDHRRRGQPLGHRRREVGPPHHRDGRERPAGWPACSAWTGAPTRSRQREVSSASSPGTSGRPTPQGAARRTRAASTWTTRRPPSARRSVRSRSAPSSRKDSSKPPASRKASARISRPSPQRPAQGISRAGSGRPRSEAQVMAALAGRRPPAGSTSWGAAAATAGSPPTTARSGASQEGSAGPRCR